MSTANLDTCGQFLMTIRDKSVKDWEMTFEGKLRSQRAQHIHQRLGVLTEDQKVLLLSLLPQIVDTTLHNLLFNLEQTPNMQLTSNGSNVVAESDGLAGELYGDHGWIARFSGKGNPY